MIWKCPAERKWMLGFLPPRMRNAERVRVLHFRPQGYASTNPHRQTRRIRWMSMTRYRMYRLPIHLDKPIPGATLDRVQRPRQLQHQLQRLQSPRFRMVVSTNAPLHKNNAIEGVDRSRRRVPRMNVGKVVKRNVYRRPRNAALLANDSLRFDQCRTYWQC